MSDAEALAAVEEDAALKERIADTFNERGRELGWFNGTRMRDEFVHDAFEWLMGVQAGLNAAGLPGFPGMALLVASVRDASVVLPIYPKE